MTATQKHIIVADQRLDGEAHWRKVLTDIELVSPTAAAKQPAQENTLIWILAGVADWQPLVRHFNNSAGMNNSAGVIVMTMTMELSELQQALAAGAHGYIHALANASSFQQAAETVASQALWLPAPMVAGVAALLTRSLTPEPATAKLAPLTDRECQVVMAVTHGLTNKEVAAELNISEVTVKQHLGAAFKKLGVRDRVQLTLYLRADEQSDNQGAPHVRKT